MVTLEQYSSWKCVGFIGDPWCKHELQKLMVRSLMAAREVISGRHPRRPLPTKAQIEVSPAWPMQWEINVVLPNRNYFRTWASADKRQNASSQSIFKEMLRRLQIGETSQEDVDVIMNLHLANYSNQEVEQILNTGVVMHLFATKAPRDEFNFKRLSEVHHQCNPVALIKAQWKSDRLGMRESTIISHFKSSPATATLLRIGALVRIVDKKFEPHWGLYNNAIGTVQEIVFRPGDDPNKGDLPLYVVVIFPQYCGPIWDSKYPKVSLESFPEKMKRINSQCYLGSYPIDGIDTICTLIQISLQYSHK